MANSHGNTPDSLSAEASLGSPGSISAQAPLRGPLDGAPELDALLSSLIERPYAFDFFHAVRLLECRRPDLPRVGFSVLPSEDPVRFWQNPSLAFAPASLESVRWTMLVEIDRKLGELLKKSVRLPQASGRSPGSPTSTNGERTGVRGESAAAPAIPEQTLRVLVHPTVLEHLQTDASKNLAQMEMRFGKLSFEADPRLRREQFRILKGGTNEELAQGQGGSIPRMAVNFFGLFGPNAPLPPHLTEYTLERELHAHDPTISAFFNLFHHRLLCLFYRAWAANQKAVDLDRPADQRYAIYTGALFGIGMEALQERDAVPDAAKLFFSGRLSCQTRNAEGLEAIVRAYFHIPAEVQPFAGRWLPLPEDSICRLGESPESGTLGINTIAGSRFWDCQLSFRLKFGPMSLADYQRMLPNGDAFQRLKYWVMNYCGQHFFWDAQLVLRADEVPPSRLGESGPSMLSTDDILDFAAFASKLSSQSQPEQFSQYLWSALSSSIKEKLSAVHGPPDLAVRQDLVNELNRLLQTGPLYEPQRFAGVSLSPDTKSLLKQNPTGADLVRLNRLLLEDVYPGHISRNRQAGGLGWTTWLQTKRFTHDAGDLILNPPRE